jgi:hypothetical protein
MIIDSKKMTLTPQLKGSEGKRTTFETLALTNTIEEHGLKNNPLLGRQT